MEYPYNLFSVLEFQVVNITPEMLENAKKLILASPLNKKGWDIIEMYYRDGKTLDDIGVGFNLTKERVRQLKSTVLSYLKANKDYVLTGKDDRAKLTASLIDTEKRIAAAKKELASLEKEIIFRKGQLSILCNIEIKSEKNEEAAVLSKDEDLSQNEEQSTIGDVPLLKNISLTDLKLDTRTYNCLSNAGLKNLYALSKQTQKSLKTVRSMGEKSLNCLLDSLRVYGIELPKDAETPLDRPIYFPAFHSRALVKFCNERDIYTMRELLDVFKNTPDTHLSKEMILEKAKVLKIYGGNK